MRNLRKVTVLSLAALLLAGGAVAQVDFTKYVALGDSLTAGFASNGLAQFYQSDSYPMILSQQFGMSAFAQPTISDPGIPAVLELKALSVVGGSIVPTIAQKSGQGQPTNATYPQIYNNLGIPGSKVNDLLTKTGNIQALSQANIMYDLVLRFPVLPGTSTPGTALAQGIGAGGTFYTVWIGNNDVLGAAVSGVAMDGVTLTPVASFQTQYTTLLGGLATNRPNATIVTANIPDVTSIPFVTTVKPYLVNPANGSHIPLIGEAGLLTENDYLTLGASALLAQGIGIPAAAGGTGLPLPEGSIDATGLHAGVILRASEVALIKQRTAELNAVIAGVAGQLGIPVWDINALFNDIKAHGYIVGGVKLSPSFLTGGFFSYDGVHPQNLGYAVIANELVKFINAELGTSVGEVNLQPYLMGAASATSIAASQTVYSWEAFEGVVKLLAPEAQMPEIGRQARTRPRSTPVDRPDRPGMPTPR